MSAHSKLGASSAYRWFACPASVRLSEGIESVSSPYAMEGTLGHEHSGHRLEHGEWRADIDPEMKSHLEVYINTVIEDCRSVNQQASSDIMIEQKFSLEQIFPGCFGTADCVVYHPALKLLRVYDLKYGAGIPVEVVEAGKPNPQLMYYGLGAMLTLPAHYQVETVELVIVQPRCFHADGPVRRHRVGALEMLDFAGELEIFARRTQDPNAPIVPGDHCGFCPAAGTCPALHDKAITLAKEEFSQTQTYDPARLSEILNWIPTFKQWISSVETFAYQEANHGRVPPGFKLVDKIARRKWRPDVNENVVSLELGLDPAALMEASMKSPAQVEKMLTKPQKEFLETLTVKESSGTTLVHESDKRPAVKIDASLEFTALP